MKKKGYEWWIKRFKAAFTLVDYVRIDHFRGFEAYWEVPASEPTATTFRIEAVPKGSQASSDSTCGTLSVDHTGVRLAGDGSAAAVDACW